MDRNTILAIIISVGIFTVFMVINYTFFQPTPPPVTGEEKREETVGEDISKEKSTGITIVPVEDEKLFEEKKTVSTNEVDVTFRTRGGLVTSIQLKKYKDTDGSPIEMIVSGETNEYPFEMRFGDYSTKSDLFHFKHSREENVSEFSRDYRIIEKTEEGENESIITLIKSFSFSEDYLLEYRVSIIEKDGGNIPLKFKQMLFSDNKDDKREPKELLYTFSFGPQIGPPLDKPIDEKIDKRRYIYFKGYKGGRKDFTGEVKSKKKVLIKDSPDWVAIEGKYFVVIARPPLDKFEKEQIGFDITPMEGLIDHSEIFFNRSYERLPRIDDTYKFYIGPNIKDILKTHTDYGFDKVISENIFLDWLSELLKLLLTFLHGLVQNWGVAIILMTIIIKILFFPLTQKGFKSTTKMQALNPKIEELKTKYKDNPQKLNAEMATLYKKEGINPLMGCLPMLIQLPIFFALYGLLGNYFDLRGAVFIPGWITDLSSPESIFRLPFTIPFLGWADVRALPLIMVGTFLFQQKVSQTPTSTTNQMKIFMYAMPVIFFFFLYEQSSGLVLYWTVQNILSIFQQMYINYVQKKKGGKGLITSLKEELVKKNIIKKKK
ncbi:MAG: membrane protein insertase YidC [Spirochaetales bacterium]|nr:membrane protein insertase YidC [Spirochaetales bacterium]